MVPVFPGGQEGVSLGPLACHGRDLGEGRRGWDGSFPTNPWIFRGAENKALPSYRELPGLPGSPEPRRDWGRTRSRLLAAVWKRLDRNSCTHLADESLRGVQPFLEEVLF